MSTILIVDDEARIRDIYETLFEAEGFTVFTAMSAMTAEEILSQRRVDVMLLDINMPEVAGDVLFSVVDSFYKRTRVIISSVYPLDEQRRRIKQARWYFDKAQGLQDLLLLVNNALKTPLVAPRPAQ